MTFQIGLLLGIVIVSGVLFSIEWISPDVVGLAVVVVLALTGLLPAERAFEGFGSDTVITILGLLIMTAALMRTGVMDITGRLILKHTGDSPTRLLMVIMCTSAGIGAFMSNTASTAFFVPIVIGIANRAKISSSLFLMPLAFSSILTSSVTLISTSTNLVVSGLMRQYKMEPMGMFELAPVGIPIAVAGLAYMYLVRRWIPDRAPSSDLMTDFGMRPYLSELMILGSSDLIGRTVAQAEFAKELGVNVIQIVRGKTHVLLPKPDLKLEENDVLLVEGKTEQLLKIRDTAGIDIKADVKLSDPNLQSADAQRVEAILLPRSPLIGRTLKGSRFRERYGVQVLGLNRHGENVRRKLSQTPLRMGDVLLLQGTPESVAALQEQNVVRVLNAVREERLNKGRAKLAISIFAVSLGLATIKVVSFPIAAILGSIVMFLTKCITPEDAYREVEWKAIVLVGSMLALGVAMEHSGTAAYLADMISRFGASAGPLWVLTGFFVVTVILTQPMSNQAAAVVILPVAIQTANKLGLNPRTFAMMIAVAASCSYLTPLEPSCLMVYGPGRYRFVDFLKIGSLLTVVIYLIAIALVPRVWPFHL